jgi:hypothetical protein
MIYYQMNGNKLTARLETPIEPNLLVPLLSVFNESSLYSTWLPRWERPMKVGVRESDLLRLPKQGIASGAVPVDSVSPCQE